MRSRPYEFCIASPHTSKYWYEYHNYMHMKQALEDLGLEHAPNTKSGIRIYFFGWPMQPRYVEG